MSIRTTLTHSMVAACFVSAALVATPIAASAAPIQAGAPASQLSVRYTAVGTSHIKSIDADLPIARTSLLSTINTKNLRVVGGTLPIAPQTVSFTTLGAVHLRATTTLTQASKIGGKLTATSRGTVLSTTVSYVIALSNVEVDFLGQWVPLGVGDDCRTVNPVVIAASSPPGQSFDIFKGGVVTGAYTIGQFQNCAPLHLPDPLGIGSIPVNALVPGTGNTVSITLSHGRSAGTSRS